MKRAIRLFEQFNKIDTYISHLNHDAYYDLYPGYSHDIGEEPDAGYRFNNQEEAEQYVLDVIEVFDSLPEKNIPIYRAIYLKQMSDLREPDYLGESWTFDLQAAKNFGSHAQCNYILSGFIDKEDVDIDKSIKNYFDFSFDGDSDSEYELVVPNTELIRDLKVTNLKEAKEIAPNPIFTRK